jgi:hypothetical protein
MQPDKTSELTFLEHLSRVPHELQSKIFLNAHILPNGYIPFGQSEFIKIDRELTIGITKNTASNKATYFQVNTPTYKKVANFDDENPFSKSLNTPEVAFYSGKGIAFYTVTNHNFHQAKKLDNEERIDYKDMDLPPFMFYKTFLKTPSYVIWFFPQKNLYEIIGVRKKQKSRLFECRALLHCYDIKKNVAYTFGIYPQETKINKVWDGIFTELHYVGEPFKETPHLLPLLLKIIKYKEPDPPKLSFGQMKTDAPSIKEYFVQAVYNLLEKSMHGWPMIQIPESPEIGIARLAPRIPTSFECTQKNWPQDAISRTDLYVLGLDKVALDFIHKTLNYIKNKKWDYPPEGIGILKKFNDQKFVEEKLKFRNKWELLWAVKYGTRGNIFKKVYRRTLRHLSQFSPGISRERIKNYLNLLIFNKRDII